MATPKTVKSDSMTPTTVEIHRDLAYVDTFRMKLWKDAGFKVLSIELRGATQKTKIPSTVVLNNGFSFTMTDETSDVYHIPVIKTQFVTTMKAIAAHDPHSQITIRIIIAMRKGVKYEFQVRGGRDKKCILLRRNDVLFSDLIIEDLERELCDLRWATCTFHPQITIASILCEVNRD